MAPHPQEDASVARFVSGDPATCRTLERWAWEFVRFRAFGIPREEAEDLVQQSLAQLWQTCRQEGFAVRFTLRALLRRIAYARTIDWIRRRRSTSEVDETLPDAGPGPEQGVAERDEWADVMQAIEKLGKKCQELLRLHFLEDCSYQQLAQRLGRPEGTLRYQIFRCIREVRGWLSP